MRSFVLAVLLGACICQNQVSAADPLADLPEALALTNPPVVGRGRIPAGVFVPSNNRLRNMLRVLENGLLRRATFARDKIIDLINERTPATDTGTSSVRAQFLVLRSTAVSRAKEKAGLINLEVFKIIQRRLRLSGSELTWFKLLLTRTSLVKGERDVMEFMQRVMFTVLPGECMVDLDLDCDANARFRSFDGSCNNLQFGKEAMGKAGSLFRRIIVDDAFEDGATMPRGLPTVVDGVLTGFRGTDEGSRLPNAREVSSSVHPTTSMIDSKLSHLVMQFGQFLDHDLTLTPMEAAFTADGETPGELTCCEQDLESEEGSAAPNTAENTAETDGEGEFSVPNQCFTINFENDPILAGRKCMNFVRSAVGQNFRCLPQNRQEVDAVSHFLDGSNIYGSSVGEIEILRKPAVPIQNAFFGQMNDTFLMSSQNFEGQELLPPANLEDSTIDGCFEDNFSEEFPCMVGGDFRANEQPVLTTIHSLFVRNHNFLANQMLEDLTPRLKQLRITDRQAFDDEFFQEVRRVNVAEYQHIVYNEFLRAILGDDQLESNGLDPLAQGFSNVYDPTVDPSISNEFATAAFRFGHTLIRNFFTRLGENGESIPNFMLENGFFTPRVAYGPGNLGGTDALLRGLLQDPEEQFDNRITNQVRDNLFLNTFPDGAPRLDLAALNIQRGRDHGLPGYLAYRRRFGLSNDFSDIDSATNFEEVFPNPEDADLFAAGISESPTKGSILGPLFVSMFVEQFQGLKFGDRFFYENGGEPGSFTLNQLNEIRRTSLAVIYCRNVRISQMQDRAFLVPDIADNPMRSCNSILADGPNFSNFFKL